MAIESWQNIIDLVRNGEPVSAEVANRAIGQLVQRTEHLKNRQDAQNLAQAIFISGAPLAVGVSTGHVVYFDPSINKFAAAYADLEFNEGILQPTKTSGAVGIVVFKDTSDSGVIVVEGWIDPQLYTDMDCDYVPMLTNLLESPNHRGVLYLASGAINAGKVLSKPGLVNVPICNLVSSSHLLVRPPVTSTLDTQALKFKLKSGLAASDIVLQKKSGTETAYFSSKPGVGALVKVYVSNGGNPTSSNPTADEKTVYLTGRVEKYTDFNANNQPSRIHLVDVKTTKEFVKAVSVANGEYADVLKYTNSGANSGDLRIKQLDVHFAYDLAVPGSASSGYPSSYVSLVSYDNTNGWAIVSEFADVEMAGWLPASSTAFANSIIPQGAVYGYNVSKDPNLHQLFPEDIVTAYTVSKNGIGLPNTIVEVNQSGIWWKDPYIELPWHFSANKTFIPDLNITLSEWTAAESDKIIMPSELNLSYVKLATGGAKVVTSLQSDSDSAITLTDPFGNPATSGPLVIRAGFSVTDASTTESGSLVVKNIAGFNMKRGRVVERLVAGNNIQLNSSFTNGQGEVTVGVVGLDGKMEGQPDILAIDDVLVERDSLLNMFYSVFPKGKASSIIGKVDIPGYLYSDTFEIVLEFTFVALHPVTNSENPPPMSLTWLSTPELPENGTQNLSSVVSSPQAISITPYSTAVLGRDCFKKKITITDNMAVPGSTLFFKLSRSSTDSYSSKFGLISSVYKFVKPQ